MSVRGVGVLPVTVEVNSMNVGLLGGDLSASSSVNFGSTLSLYGSASLASHLSLAKEGAIGAHLSCRGRFDAEQLNVTDKITCGSTLSVAGLFSKIGCLSAGDALIDVIKKLGVQDKALAQDLSVRSAASSGSDLSVTEDACLYSLSTSASQIVGIDLSVKRTSFANSIFSAGRETVFGSSLSVRSFSTLSSRLSVIGNGQLGSSVTVRGPSLIGEPLSVSSDKLIGQSLSVNGGISASTDLSESFAYLSKRSTGSGKAKEEPSLHRHTQNNIWNSKIAQLVGGCPALVSAQ
jgi:hypothetical protein